MSISYEVRGLNELIVKYTDAADGIQGRLMATMELEAVALQSEISDTMALLFHNPEKMQQSLSHDTTFYGTEGVITTVTADGLPYLAIQEYGGTVQTPEIFPVKANVLAFVTPGMLQFGGIGNAASSDLIFTKHTRAHETSLPERSFMRSSLARRKPNILDAIRNAVRGYLD